jgi:hypothetical protein
MRLAFLLCGTPRTFIFEQQINHFQNLKLKFPNADFFILIKLPVFQNKKIEKFKPGSPYTEHFIQTDKGLENLNKQLINIKPKFLKVFTDYKYKYNSNKINLFSQWYMIDYLLKKANQYSEINNFNYDYFIRYRLDWNCSCFNLDFNQLNSNYVYSEIKDKQATIGADFLFILSLNLYKEWWIKTINDKLKHINKTENLLWQGTKVIKCDITNGGLVRDYKVISFWDKDREKKFNHDNYWNNFNINEYELMHKIQSNKNLYFEKLNEILSNFDTRYSFYLED